MKYKIFYLVNLFLLISCKEKESKNNYSSKSNSNEITSIINDENIEADQKNIIGTWNWRSDDKSQEFTIKIKKVSNDSIFGQYCAVSNNGNKLDCDFDDINNIKGLIIGNKIQITFNSFFGAKNGSAEITIFDKYIEWKVTKSPKGEYYAPQSATLYRKEDKESQLNNAINGVNYKKNRLPFDFKKYNDANDRGAYIIYSSDEFPELTKIINDQINEFPIVFFIIDNGGMSFETYVIETDGDSTTQILVNISNNKVVGSEIVGYQSDSSNTFIINKDLAVSMYKINESNNSMELTGTLQIKKDGSIVKK